MRELVKVIKGCKKGNSNAQASLYNRFAPTLYAVCLRYCANTYDAEDCLHDGFIKIFSKLDSYNGNGSFEGWIKRIMVNICIDKYRNRYEFVPLNDSQKEEDVDVTLINDDEQFLIEAIQSLPPKYRAVFNLYAIENLKHKEIAQQLQISEGTSRSNYLRAKKILIEKISYLKKDGRQAKAYYPK